MTLPTTYGIALLLTILSMICWGSWANTLKLTGKWRFELFYYDYSIGVVLAAVIAALTFGTFGEDLSFLDTLSIAGRRQMAYGLLGGVIFNLANLLLVGAISIAGMAVAFPIGIGLALVIGVVWNYLLKPQGNPMFLFGGAALVVLAIVLDAMAYGEHSSAKTVGKEAKGASKTKGIVISLISGLLMGSFYPLVQMGKDGDLGLGPYGIAVVFSVGVFLSTLIFNIYFMNLPLKGKPVDFKQYFTGTPKLHALGIIGGVIWCIGAITNFVAASAPASVHVGPAVSYALGQGATMISALWGLLVWKEFEGASGRVKLLLTLMMFLFLAGLVLISLAPLYAT